MEGLTTLIAIVGVGVVVLGRPISGLIAYLAILMLYPDFLRVSLGTLDISASRIVITALLLKCLATPGIVAKFRWRTLDVLVALSMAVYAGTLFLTTPTDVWIENRGGFVMDTFFAYIAVRLIVVDRAAFEWVARTIALIVLPLAALAAIECATSWSPYAELGKYCPWAPNRGSVHQERFGYFRAEGPFGETIMLGLFFTVTFAIIWTLRLGPKPWRSMAYVSGAACSIGVLSTLSSGPYLAMFITIGCLLLEQRRWLIKPLLIALLLVCVAIELVSNRHFYDVFADRFALNSGTAWYRSELFEVAIRQLPNYWLQGHGLKDPGWGPMIDGREKTDGVNDYVVYAVVYGILGLTAYVSVLVVALRNVTRAQRDARSPWRRSMAWALGSALVGLMVASWTVSIFTQLQTVLYILFGLMGGICFALVPERVRAIPGCTAPVRQAQKRPAALMPPRGSQTQS